MKAATCHPTRIHKAHGLCASCYNMKLRGAVVRQKKKALCHPGRKHRALNMCQACYDKLRRDQGRKPQLPRRAAKIMQNWMPKLEDPAVVLDIIRRVFNSPKKLEGRYSA